MKDRTPAVDAHAYVDNCLTAEARKAFEVQLRQDEELRRQVELWQAQNEAIRSSFGGQAQCVTPNAVDRRPGAAKFAFGNGGPSGRGDAAEQASRQGQASRGAAPAAAKNPSANRRLAFLAVLTLIGGALFPTGMAYPQRATLADFGVAAFRAFSVSPEELDFRGAGPNGLTSAFGPPFAEARLSELATPAQWSLRGGKHVPGLQGEAALILLDGKEKAPLGLWVEPLDAPASGAIRLQSRDGMTIAAFVRRGYGFAVVSRDENEVEAWLAASGFRDQGEPHATR